MLWTLPDDDPPRPRPPRAERGKALAKYLTAIVDAYERATTRALVVSAFRQDGIRYMIPDPRTPDRWVSYVDRSEARAVKSDKGLFLDLQPVTRPAPGQTPIADLILNPQRLEPMPVVSTRPVRVHEGPEISLTNQATATQTENNAAARAAPDGALDARAQLPGLSAARAAPNSTLTGRAASTEEPARTAHLPDIAAA